MTYTDLWNRVEEESLLTNCKDRAVGCIIYDVMAGDIVGKGHNEHANGICDCDTTKTASHAEVNAIDNMHSKRLKGNLIALINHAPCCDCTSKLSNIVSEVRYRDQKG